jgi:N-acetyl-beta-hexosaminidase
MVRRHADRYIQHCVVDDTPYAAFRGLMVDIARQPHTLETLKQLVVLCWFYKIRYLQIHLTDTQAFTFPSTRFPRLATPHNCLSLAEWHALEAFSSERGVTIVPELDVPGHACENLKRLCPTRPRTGHQVINPVSERTFDVLDTLIGEMCAVFKSTPYFHIGADEVSYAGWANCRDCAAEMKRLGLGGVEELYRRFIVRMNDIVKSHGKRTIVWEGFAAQGETAIPNDIIIQFFDVYYMQPEEAIGLGHDIINSCWGPLYVAGPHAASPVEMIYKWHPALYGSSGLYALPDAFDHAPALGETAEPTFFYDKPFAGTYFPRVKAIPENREKTLGAGMATWEMRDADQLPALRRRLAALSERIWNPRSTRSYADFSRRVDVQDDRLTALLDDVLQSGRDDAPGMTEFVRTFRITDVLPSASLATLSPPGATAWHTVTFPEPFADRHAELSAAGTGMVFYACKFECGDAMRLVVHLGYDGPVKLWVDGKAVFTDPSGTNPAVVDSAKLGLTAPAGPHEIVVGLDANDGCAHGIFLRLQRTDRPDLLPRLVA